jgi:cellulose synthase/poly-beta-1,6-N-acetylglucosamine synthase-like glycosyltransferase
MDLPTVSVIIPTIERESLGHAVISALAQDYAGSIEVVIVRDGPEGGWPFVPVEGRPPRTIVKVDLGRNWRTFLGAPGGLCEVPLLVGAYVASGELITLLSDDDEYSPGLIKAYVEEMLREELDVLLGPLKALDLDRTRYIYPTVKGGVSGVDGFMFRAELLRKGTWNPLYGTGAAGQELVERWVRAGARAKADPNLPFYIMRRRGLSWP